MGLPYNPRRARVRDRKPNIEMVLKVADVFGANPEHLMRDEVELDEADQEEE